MQALTHLIAFCIRHSKSANVTGSKNVKLVDLYIRWTTTTTKIFARKVAGNLTTNYLRTLAGSDNLRLFTMYETRTTRQGLEVKSADDRWLNVKNYRQSLEAWPSFAEKYLDVDGKPGLVGVVERTTECGCTIVGCGTLQFPLAIQFCEKHS